MNIALLSGSVASEPEHRSLADGSSRWSFDLTTVAPRAGSRAGSGAGGAGQRLVVPVVVVGADRPPAAARAGADVVVVGRVQRRFFRSGGATVSRTEVTALEVVAVTRRRPIGRAVAAALAVLGADERTTLRSGTTG